MRKLTASLGLWALMTAAPALAQFPFAAPADPLPPAEAITIQHPADLPGEETIAIQHPADLPGDETIAIQLPADLPGAEAIAAQHPADLPAEGAIPPLRSQRSVTAEVDSSRGNLTVSGPRSSGREAAPASPAFDTGTTYAVPRRNMAQQLIFERARFRARQRVQRIEARKWANISLLRPTIGNPNRPPLTPPYYGFGYPYPIGPRLIIVDSPR